MPELDALLRNPQLDPRAKARRSRTSSAAPTSWCATSSCSRREEPRRRDRARSSASSSGSSPREERRLNVELTTAYELSDDEARQIIGQIEQASGRTVEATRKVDPDLIGGIVLQAGSMRVDASVRGRLERLRRELTTSEKETT